MTLKDGKFWENVKEVPAQIGNTEQIALLKRANSAIEDAETNGIEMTLSGHIKELEIISYFECFCGAYLSDNEIVYGNNEDVDDFDADYYADAFDGNKIKCRKCGREYELRDGRAKLIKK